MRIRSVIVTLFLLGALVATLPLLATASKQAREIVLVARQMAFYADGGSTPNPVIRLKPGERVRLTLKNEDTGVLHDFSIKDLGVATGTLKSAERASVVFDVPRRPAEYRYVCRPHAKMMAGIVEVQ